MSDAERNTLFRLAIRDSGHHCDDVGDSSAIGDERRFWRVRCDEAGVYWVRISDLEQLAVEATAWDDSVY